MAVTNRLMAENDELKKEIKRYKDNAWLRDALLKTEGKREYIRETSQPNEELKQRSLELSKELFQFLDERAKEDPQGGYGDLLLSNFSPVRGRCSPSLYLSTEVMQAQSSLTPIFLSAAPTSGPLPPKPGHRSRSASGRLTTEPS